MNPFQLVISPTFPPFLYYYITANRFAVAKTEIATRTKITVLRGVKEQEALYPNRQVLLAFRLGIAVLIAAILKETIIKTKTIVCAFIVLFHHLFHSSIVAS